MKYRKILFDLDGTLTDPKEGICKSVQHALRAFDIDEPDLDNLEKFIGPPLTTSFTQFYGFDETMAQRAVEVYRERFGVVGLYENKVYDGIPELLKKLKEKGFILAVASSKPTVYVEKILTHFGLDSFFDVVVGSELDGRRVEKDEVIEETLQRLYDGKEPLREEIVMIGDRSFDVIGAKKHGLSSIGVEYGYSQPGEFETAGADRVCATVLELADFLLEEEG